MKRLAVFFLFVASLFPESLQSQEANDPPVFAHYMPWYASKPVSGSWGWHWTMDHYDPDTVRWNGKREVASHDYPMIGLYDSNDPDTLECHAQQMKLAGIDGVIFDWYGIEKQNDYPQIHRSTQAMIAILKRAGMKFAICYEDQSKKKSADPVASVAADFAWMNDNWFQDDAYFKIDDKPAMLVFGPQFLKKDQWKSALGDFQDTIHISALPHLAAEFESDSAFAWPPVDGGKTVLKDEYEAALNQLYENPANLGVVFPGFRDIYQQAGVGESYGRISDRDGATFSETLDLALKKNPPLVQIATWNDFGEGTFIEPTRSLGYRYLDMLQSRLKPDFSSTDLRIPAQLYRLRKTVPNHPDLKKASDFLLAGKVEQAAPFIKKIEMMAAKTPVEAGSKYRIASNILYHENPPDDYAKNRCRLDVYHPADGKKFGTVVWFHGGGISKGHREIPLPLRDKGIAVVTANYRMNPRVEAPTYIEDAAAAVAWTMKNIEKFGGSRDSVFVSGHSAGGYLASMVGLDKKYLAAHDIDADDLAGLIPFSGHTITHFTVRKERGIPGHQPIVDEFAPLFHVRKDAPPMLLITGDRDLELMGRYDENAYFWRMMEVAGHKETTIRELEGFDHGAMPEPAFPLLLKFMDQN